jgi:Uma2 family endonuclease
MGLPLKKSDRRYTYGDYKNWPEDERWELIDGEAWNMSPAPNRAHQGLLAELVRQIGNQLEGRPCRMYFAPFDVLLPDEPEEDEDEVATVVQPDLLVVCDPDKLTPKGATGAPDFVIEILSPHTARKDLMVKLSLYERHAVREYWLVDPGNRYVLVHCLKESGRYPEEPELHVGEGQIAARAVEGLVVDMGRAFKSMA